MRTCDLPGCENRREAKGLCKAHYARLRALGDPLWTRPTIADRLARDSAPEGECLVWTGYRDRRNYGVMQLDGRPQYVHRVAWVERNGEIPDETPCVLHRCDNPPCFKEGHLFLGTIADNNADRSAKGRTARYHSQKTHCAQGHPFDDANTYRPRPGRRVCRACTRAAQARRQARLRGASA